MATDQTIVVIGCAGFIRSDLIDGLPPTRHMVVSVDDFSTGRHTTSWVWPDKLDACYVRRSCR